MIIAFIFIICHFVREIAKQSKRKRKQKIQTTSEKLTKDLSKTTENTEKKLIDTDLENEKQKTQNSKSN